MKCIRIHLFLGSQQFAHMCLTIPKKVISIDNDTIIVKTPLGEKQELKSIIKVKKDDYVFSQQNVIIQKISKKQAEELMRLLGSK